MTEDHMDDYVPEEKNDENANCLGLLRDCLAMIHAMLERRADEERRWMEEASLRESQYPCDEYGEMFYDEDFKFDWL